MDSKTYAGERLLSAWLTLSSTLWNERVVSGMTFNEAFVCNLLSHQAQEALNYVDSCPLPTVVKADGLALGKGVLICQTREEAREAVQAEEKALHTADAVLEITRSFKRITNL